MSCPDCQMRGFTYHNGEFTSRSGRKYTGIDYVRRCSLYIEYFQELKSLDLKPIFAPALCDAASRRHEDIQAFAKRKDERKSKRQAF